MKPVITKRNMLKPTKLYDLARERLKELRIVESEKALALQKYPPGKIHIVKSSTRVQYYLRMDAEDKSGAYMRKRDVPKIRKYLQKSYDEKILKLIRKEIKNIEYFLKHSKEINIKIKQAFSNNPGEVQNYINPIDCQDEDYANYWKSIPYEKNPIPVPTTEYETNRGEYVRSKSELNIANFLSRAGIPYKYECQLKLKNGSVVYPDFTILQTGSRKILYWEHRGMMDDREYTKNAVKKQKDYIKNGIIIGQNPIVTEETSINPLGTDEIQAIVNTILFL